MGAACDPELACELGAETGLEYIAVARADDEADGGDD